MHEGQMDILQAQCFNRPGVIGGDIDLEETPPSPLKGNNRVKEAPSITDSTHALTVPSHSDVPLL
jgi:hypothetical protein